MIGRIDEDEACEFEEEEMKIGASLLTLRGAGVQPRGRPGRGLGLGSGRWGCFVCRDKQRRVMSHVTFKVLN